MFLIIISSCDGTGYTSTMVYESTDNSDFTLDACKWHYAKHNSDCVAYMSRGECFIVSTIDKLLYKQNTTNVNGFISEYKKYLKDVEEKERAEYMRLKEKYEEIYQTKMRN